MCRGGGLAYHAMTGGGGEKTPAHHD
jgi:hypothetical protein